MPGQGPRSAEDAALLARSAGGDTRAFEVLVARHGGPLLRFLRWLGAGAGAEDLVQETFLAAWRSPPRFRTEGSVRSWLFTPARRRAHRAWRRAASERDNQPLSELAEAAGSAVEQTLDTARQVAEAIRRAPQLHLIREPDLTVLLFERRGWQAADYQAWSREQALARTILCLPTIYQGRTVARLAFVNPATRADEVMAVLHAMPD